MQYLVRFRRLSCSVLALWVYSTSLAQAQTAGTNESALSHTFSYSIIDTSIATDALVQTLQRDLLPTILEPEEKVFAIWLPVAKPDDAPFAGLALNQVGLMIAWPTRTVPAIAALDLALSSQNGVTKVSTRMFEPVYLADGFNIPTAAGFYVHREEHYSNADVREAIRLSQEAWVTWEPAFGVKVIGLFREVSDNPDFVNLNRIAWYPSYEGWLDTRNTTTDPESARRFRDRRQLLIEGSGIAIATDRVLP